MKPIDLGIIQGRRIKLDADIARLKAQLEELETRRNELDLAEKVLIELLLESGETKRGAATESPDATSSTLSDTLAEGPPQDYQP